MLQAPTWRQRKELFSRRRKTIYDRHAVRNQERKSDVSQALLAMPKVGFDVEPTTHERILKQCAIDIFVQNFPQGVPPKIRFSGSRPSI